MYKAESDQVGYTASSSLSRNCYYVHSVSMLLLLLSRFSRVRLCATPETAAHQAPPPWDSPGKNTGVGCHFLLHSPIKAYLYHHSAGVHHCTYHEILKLSLNLSAFITKL